MRGLGLLLINRVSAILLEMGSFRGWILAFTLFTFVVEVFDPSSTFIRAHFDPKSLLPHPCPGVPHYTQIQKATRLTDPTRPVLRRDKPRSWSALGAKVVNHSCQPISTKIEISPISIVAIITLPQQGAAWARSSRLLRPPSRSLFI